MERRSYRGADGATLAVRELGQGPCVVLLHGFAMESRHWLPFAWAMRKRFRFLIPDLRGFGGSHDAGFRSECVLEELASDLESLLCARGVERAVLAGISMGALASVHALSTREAVAERIIAYAHIDQSPKVTNGQGWHYGLFGRGQQERFARFERLLRWAEMLGAQTPYEELPRAFRRQVWEAFGDFGAQAMGSPAGKAVMGQIFGRELVGRRYLPMRRWSNYMACMRSYMSQDYDQREAFVRMAQPVTLFVGMRSTMYPPQGQLHIKTLRPEVEVVHFARSGHSLPFEQPLKFTRELESMILRSWDSSGDERG